MNDRVPEHVAMRHGHEYQASEIERDPTLCPHFSQEGRDEIVRALRILALIDGRECALVPLEPTYAMLRALHGNVMMPASAIPYLTDAYRDLIGAAPSWDELRERTF